MVKEFSQKQISIVDDGSEDELAGDVEMVGDQWAKRPTQSRATQNSTSHAKQNERKRPKSPSDLDVTPFTNSRRAGIEVAEDSEKDSEQESGHESNKFIPLKLLVVPEPRKDKNMGLRYDPGSKAFLVEIDGVNFCDKSGRPWRLTGPHAQTLTYNSSNLLQTVLNGAKNGFSHGKICLEFWSSDNLKQFLERIMAINERVKILEKNP